MTRAGVMARAGCVSCPRARLDWRRHSAGAEAGRVLVRRWFGGSYSGPFLLTIGRKGRSARPRAERRARGGAASRLARHPELARDGRSLEEAKDSLAGYLANDGQLMFDALAHLVTAGWPGPVDPRDAGHPPEPGPMDTTLALIPIDRDGTVRGYAGALPETTGDVLRATAGLYATVGFEAPWICYLALADGAPVGTCGFKSRRATGGSRSPTSHFLPSRPVALPPPWLRNS